MCLYNSHFVNTYKYGYQFWCLDQHYNSSTLPNYCAFCFELLICDIFVWHSFSSKFFFKKTFKKCLSKSVFLVLTLNKTPRKWTDSWLVPGAIIHGDEDKSLTVRAAALSIYLNLPWYWSFRFMEGKNRRKIQMKNRAEGRAVLASCLIRGALFLVMGVQKHK